MANKNKYLLLVKKHSRNSRGVTLIELVTAVGILAVMVAVAIPVIGTAMQGTRVRAAARKVSLDLRFARAAAVQQNGQFIVTFTSTPPNYSYALTCNPCPGGAPPGPVANLFTDAPNGIVNIGTLFPGVTFLAGDNAKVIGFTSGQGAFLGGPIAVTVTNGIGMTRTITAASPTGSITISNP